MFGLGKNSLDHRRREEFPAIFVIGVFCLMKQLSIFIDESGDFGEVKERPAYYLVSFVFHDQAKSIAEMAARLEDSIQNAEFL